MATIVRAKSHPRKSLATAVAPARGQRGRLPPPPMLKKMTLVILPNSMRKLGCGVGIHLRCGKIIHTKYSSTPTFSAPPPIKIPGGAIVRLVCKGSETEYEKLMKKTFTIHQHNLQLLMIEVYKTKHNLNPTFMRDVFTERNNQYNLRSENHLQLPVAEKQLHTD